VGRKKTDLNEPLKGKKAMFSRSNKGSICPKIGIPLSWLAAIEVTENEPNIKVYYENNKIIIEKEGV
jgi:hypothetical protein